MAARTEPRPRSAARFETSVSRTIRKHGMLRAGSHVLVAVSGGADSTALLHALDALRRRLALRLTAAHLNHRLRGDEADADARFVAELCASTEVPLVAGARDVGAEAAAAGRNLEEAAREARYDFLRRAAAEARADRVALGHTLDDQAETVLMRLFRGSGIDGVAGIHPIVDGLFVRPLLETPRREIVAYLETLGVPWREDSTNCDLRYERNRIRRELVPYLEAHFNPAAVEALARHAEAAREAADFLGVEAARSLQEISSEARGGVSIEASKLAALHPALGKLVVRKALDACRGSARGITSRHIEALIDLALPGRSGRKVDLPAGWQARREFGALRIAARGSKALPAETCELRLPGIARLEATGWELEARIVPRASRAGAAAAPASIVLDADLLPEALAVRTRRPGDRYGTGRRKLKKLLIDARVPVRERDTLPVVVAGPTVVWVPGLRPPRSFLPRPSTTRCILLEARRLLGELS